METKYVRKKKLEENEIENNIQFYKLFQIKQKVTKSKEKTNWRTFSKKLKGQTQKREKKEKKRLLATRGA